MSKNPFVLKDNKLKKDKPKFLKVLDFTGTVLIFLSVLGIILTFGPATSYEVKYQTKETVNKILEKSSLKSPLPEKEITPVNTDFSIVIPKIEASAAIVDNVDPFNEKEFLIALRRGVAHAKGTSYPGEIGNTYLFAHSTDAFYNVGRYNAVFYLIGKLDSGDQVDIYYKGVKFEYLVYDKMVVSPENVSYLKPIKAGVSTLTLQTCYPPGTTLKRLVVLAQLKTS